MDYFDLINRSNADYIERLQQQFQADPRSLPPEWQAFFAGFEAGSMRSSTKATAPTLATPSGDASPATSTCSEAALAVESADLVHSYRELGHLIADLDPLGHNRATHPLLELSEFNLTLADLDCKCGTSGFLGGTEGTVRDLISNLRETYCRTVGVQYMDIADKAQREWLQQRMEPVLNRPHLTSKQRRALLYELVAAQGFEEFLATRYQTTKRFGLEGAESLIPLLNMLVNEGATLGIDEIVMGMAHRGRLNTLAHVLNKPYDVILGEFEGRNLAIEHGGDGDVKYHLGYSQDRTTQSGRKVHIALSFNPSHLELVNPVVEGIVRAKQYYLGDIDRGRVVPILIHGDAAFTGQGVVLETLALSEMPFWRTGGTIHIIINNQIGFTTMPKQGRFTPYPTDVAKTIQAPIFHVNADDPEAVIHVAKLAVAFRQQFKCDVMIDLYCYRKMGHNETDVPSYTQPLMYKEIEKHPPVREIFSKRLIEEHVVSQAEFDQMKSEAWGRMDKAHAIAKEARPRTPTTTLGGIWKGMTRAGADWSAVTKIPADILKRLGDALNHTPKGFTVHPKLRSILSARHEMTQGKRPLDWGTAEALALATLLMEGTPIRFVGQDAQRGTFSHRHSCLHDYNTGEKYYPLANLGPKQADIIIVNTMLSELAVLGFEYGFSSADPRNLVVWEAQFGDFVNGAQPIIDQFIAAAESKWHKFSGLVMLLPHGYEGGGPEHSYAYLDRFLALCAENNLQVCVPSVPAQYFHVLRRQMRRTFRKPLVMMMPKSLLRVDAKLNNGSELAELTDGAFQVVIDDPAAPQREKVRRLLLCSGKMYFWLQQAKQQNKLTDVAIVRVEQLYPFPQKEIQAILAKYRGATEISWVQEESRNRGAWMFMRDRLEPMLPETAVMKYYGREEAASPATGSAQLHKIEEEEILTHALDLPPKKNEREAPVSVAAPTAAPAPTPQEAAQKD